MQWQAFVFWFSAAIFMLSWAYSEKINKFIVWLYWDFSGLHSIWDKINPPPKIIIERKRYKKPPTFLLWAIGIYSVLFGIASQRYENRVDMIETRAAAILTQLPTEAFKNAISRIPEVQRLKCPYKPEFLSPLSVVRSLISNSRYLEGGDYKEMIDLLRITVENWKTKLNKTDLSRANLQGAKLNEANLQGAKLVEANFQKANLISANLQETDLSLANLQETDLSLANLQGADLMKANSQKANLKGAKLQEAKLWGAKLQEAKLWKANLRRADLQEADLQGAKLQGANLLEANLKNAKLQGANLWGADLQEANLWGADLQGANLWGAKLQNAINLTADKLCMAMTLYEVTNLDPKLQMQVAAKCPYLFTSLSAKADNLTGRNIIGHNILSPNSFQ